MDSRLRGNDNLRSIVNFVSAGQATRGRDEETCRKIAVRLMKKIGSELEAAQREVEADDVGDFFCGLLTFVRSDTGLSRVEAGKGNVWDTRGYTGIKTKGIKQGKN